MSEYQTHEYSRALDHLKRAMREGWQERKELSQSVFYFTSALLTRFEQYDDSMGLLFATVKTTPQTDLLVEPLGLAALGLPLLPIEIPPDQRELVRMAGQGFLSIENQQHGDTDRIFSAMVAAYPNEPGVHFLYGAYLMDVRPEDGIREMKRELEISPSHVGARLRLAEEYVKEQKFDEAMKYSEEATKLEPKSAAAHMMWGETLVAKGDTAKGIAELEQAEKLAPETVRTHWDLLRAYTSVGRSSDAKREKERIEEVTRPETKPMVREN
jgi:predicted Zn-dependent protease